MKKRKILLGICTAIMGSFICVNANASELISTDRISGMSRYETSIKVSQKGWSESDVAVLVTGENYPDAISSAPLAKKYNAPILLTSKNKISSELENEIKRLGVKTVYIIGGTGVISNSVETSLNSMGILTNRINGNDRYETSVKVAETIGQAEEVFVATGDSFADALSVSTVAASKNSPIILSQESNLNADAKQYIKNNGISKSYVIGGEKLINNKILKSLPSSERIAGNNRYETNYKILNKFKNDLDFNNIYVATGSNFPDALSGAGIASKTNSPIVLTSETVDINTKKIISENKNNIKKSIVLGGESAINTNTLAQLDMKEKEYMSDILKPYYSSCSYRTNNTEYLKMGGNSYTKGYSFSSYTGVNSFNLGKKYKCISGILGCRSGAGFSVEFFCDDESRGIYEFNNGDLPRIVDIDVSGVEKFEIKIKSSTCADVNFANVVMDSKGSITDIDTIDKEHKEGYMSDILTPYYSSCGYRTNNAEYLKMGGNSYTKGYSFSSYTGVNSFNLRKKYKCISGILGCRSGAGFSVEFFCDDESRGIYEFNNGDLPRIVDIDVSGVEKFEIKIKSSTCADVNFADCKIN
ncbi:cell wall-binding repeat-containing protein [Clostridium senegalense]|uniref:cell wall-binding repeat-containing protein n=1 Tax=Clostridium senegalense TaxID=1465809 RepID=UPI001C121547|nr:cell wall-binding repeat-containing protein [Clostridium senegalense]MBU5228059.1 cell wall-binding repeat-containing protein [Clostridium senegalense]